MGECATALTPRPPLPSEGEGERLFERVPPLLGSGRGAGTLFVLVRVVSDSLVPSRLDTLAGDQEQRREGRDAHQEQRGSSRLAVGAAAGGGPDTRRQRLVAGGAEEQGDR